MAGIVATLLLYAATAISCYGGTVSPMISPFFSVLVIGMPIMVTLSAIVTITWFCTGHWIVGSFGVAMFILCASPIRMWFPMHSEQEASPGAPVIKIMTWNTLHGADLEKPEYKGSRMMETVLKEDPDVVCLQELFGFEERLMSHFSQSTLDSLMARYPYRLGDGTYDLRILSKYPLRHIYFGSAYHFTLAEYFTVKVGGREFAMANVHLPSFALDENEKTIFSMRSRAKGDSLSKETLGKHILHKLEYAFPIRANSAEKVIGGFERLYMPVIVCGDFNDVPASWVYRMFLDAGFKDAYCETNFFPTNTFYPHGFYFHLDQIFYRGAVRPLSVKRIGIKTSDHYPLVATFELIDPIGYE